jgi:hypothetical protein
MVEINLENSGIDISSGIYDKNPDVFIEIEGVRVHSIGESIQDHISFQNKWGIKKDDLTYKEYCFIKLYSQDGYAIVNEFFRTLPNVKDSDFQSFYKEYEKKWSSLEYLGEEYIPFDDFLEVGKSIFDKGMVLDEDLLVFRRQSEPLSTYSSNGIYHSDSFLSTSISKNVKSEEYGEYLEYILIPKGTKILYIEVTGTKFEYEILFDKGLNLKKIGQKNDKITCWKLL